MEPEIDYLKPDGRLCCKCDKSAIYINGATIPVCKEHDTENTYEAKMIEAIKSMGYPV